LRIPKITVVGSYAAGLTMRVPRLPNRGETLLGTGYRVDYGGKGSNQAVGCARLGAEVSFVAKVGNDSFGEMALKLYREEGLDVRYVRRTAEAPTGVGFILVEENSGHNCIAIDPGANDCLTAADVVECEAAFADVAVVLSQLEISTAAAEAGIRLGRERGAITILNPAPVRPLSSAVLAMVDVLTPNITEAKVLAGLNPEDTAEPEKIASTLLHRGAKQIVMTLGEQGALIVTESSVVRIPATRVNAVDTTGAGDAFNAGLATGLAAGASLEEAVQFAVACGGLAVTRAGVIPSLPYRDDIARIYRQQGRAIPSWLPAEVKPDPRPIGTRGAP
jgi:ribokinase